MKKILKDKPKLLLLVELVLVIILIISAFITGYFSKDVTTEETPTEESAVKIYSHTEEEIAAAVKKKTVSGKVVSAVADKVTIKVDNQNVSFSITENTAIEKGVSLTAVTYEALAVGTQVSVLYNIETNEAINIWFEK